MGLECGLRFCSPNWLPGEFCPGGPSSILRSGEWWIRMEHSPCAEKQDLFPSKEREPYCQSTARRTGVPWELSGGDLSSILPDLLV